MQSLPLKSSVSAFNYAFIYHHDKENDLHTIGCLDVDLVNLTRYKVTEAETVEQVECLQVKIDPIDEATQFCLIEFHSFKFLSFELFVLISSNGLHVGRGYLGFASDSLRVFMAYHYKIRNKFRTSLDNLLT